MARGEIPAHVIIAELVCPAVLLALNVSFIGALSLQFGGGFQIGSMVLTEAAILNSLGLIAYVLLFVLFPQMAMATASRVMWLYIFTSLWVRILTFCSVLSLASGAWSWYSHRATGGGILTGPFLWGCFSCCLAVAGWARVRWIQNDDRFSESDQRIRDQAEWFKTRFVKGGLVQKKRMGLKDMPSAILLLMFFFLVGLYCLVLGITAIAKDDLFALVPLLFGAALTLVPFYWLALLASQLRGKPLTLVAILEGVAPGTPVIVPDPLAGQRTLLLLGGLFSIVPLAVSSVQAAWGGFIFGALIGPAGFIGLNIARERLARRQRLKPMDTAAYEHMRQRLVRRGCDYGLILLVAGLLVVTVVPGIVAWGTGEVLVMAAWRKWAFPVWAWLMLAALSSWYQRIVKPVWPDDVDATPGLKLTEIITWPFQLFFFLNPWEVLIRTRTQAKPTSEA